MASDSIASEQAYVSMLYDWLDGLQAQTADRLARVLRESGGGPRALSERDAAAARYAEQLTRLRAAEHGLCFGRLDLSGGERRYIGRLGIFDERADYEPLLVDWRAPAARPFYVATAAAPDGVRRRRHLRTRDRTVVELLDEVLERAAVDGHSGDGELTGEAALLAALDAGRTGRMGDIVATIQAEQDQAIRSDHRGVLVVEGGPGTGKTAVALHRAAYLLYTYRQELASRGVLIVGPNPTFLRYIDQVLPSLGETGVLLSTVGDLYPGVRARAAEPPEAAELKGRPVMAEVVAGAVRDRQRVPDDAREVVTADTHPGFGFQRETLLLDPPTCDRARELARRSRRPHNQARAVFAEHIVDALARRAADRLGADPYAEDPLGGADAPGADSQLLSEADVADIAGELRADPAVHAALDELWPVLTPQRLLAELYGSKERIAAAATQLTEAERRLLWRAGSTGWTAADIPLLDEAAELLGQDRPHRRARDERSEELAYAQGVLEIAAGSESIDAEDELDPEVLAAHELMDAGMLVERQERRDTRTVAERAAADRRWAFGHVIVDEAQELSPMAWRMVMRRCPSRSMTLVGDLAQTGDPAGASSWEAVLVPYVGDRWRLERLSVNYRTPAEIMAVAAEALAGLASPVAVPRSVRHTGTAPWRVEVGPAELAERLPGMVTRELAEVADGRLAVIVPAALLDELGRALVAAVPDAAAGPEPAVLDSRVAVLAVRHAKGLEFDSVVVVEPERILAESPRGANDLYVALTRATRRLGIVRAR
jgi:DNA helicase IV